eukprot:g8587.t1
MSHVAKRQKTEHATTDVKEDKKCKLISEVKSFGGKVRTYCHQSTSTKTEMKFAVFLPPASEFGPVPVLYWLSGLTCDTTNFMTKAGAQKYAAEHGIMIVAPDTLFYACFGVGIMIVAPDTSPRGAGVASEDASWDLGTGAGFYVDATQAPWKEHYNMFTYVTCELPALVEKELPANSFRSISGHSMGGHGALVIALRLPSRYVSVSALAPITHPNDPKCAWGKKAFDAYLGEGSSERNLYDACALLRAAGKAVLPSQTILVDQGEQDKFLMEHQLQPEELEKACAEVKQPLLLRMQPGYDHSYDFVSSFIGDHIRHHATQLKAAEKKAAAEKAKAEEGTHKPATKTKYQSIECLAAVAWGPSVDQLKIETVTVAPPKQGEVRLRVIANALCHTDIYTLTGQDPEGLFPCILGHEAGCVVESVGLGVEGLDVGDHVIPCYTPQCGSAACIFCQSSKTNLCPSIRGTQGKGVMPDGTSRFTCKDQAIYHFMGTSTFSEYTVVAAISCAKISPQMPLSKACLLGCGVATGLGAVWNTCQVETGATVAVFGLGAVGLSVVQAAKVSGASRIFGIDINKKKFTAAMSLGCTDVVCPTDYNEPIVGVLQRLSPTGWGIDYTFDCTGSTTVMRHALEAAHRGWGVSCVIGVAASGQEIATRPFQLITGRTWKGTAFGGWKSRAAVPKLVNSVLAGEFAIDQYVTHRFQGIEGTMDAIHALESGDCLRAVVSYEKQCKL